MQDPFLKEQVNFIAQSLSSKFKFGNTNVSSHWDHKGCFYLVQRLRLSRNVRHLRNVAFLLRLPFYVHLVVQSVLELDRAGRFLLAKRLVGLAIETLAAASVRQHLFLLLLHSFPFLLRERFLIRQHHG